MAHDKVIIVGGGIGGLSLAVGLQRAGIPIAVHEQQPEIRELGTGVGIQAVAIQALDQLGLGEAVRKIGGTPFEAQLLRSARTSRVIARIPRRGEAFVVHRGELLATLLRELPDASVITCNSKCVGLELDDRGVTVRFADGREDRGVALVGADGVRSIIRGQTVGDGQPLYSGQTAWRGMPVFEHPSLPRNLCEQVWGPGSLFGLFPCDERLFWYASDVRPEGADGGPAERKSDLLRTFGSWPESIREVIETTPDAEISRGDLYYRRGVGSWTNGTATLLGDAAHPTLPAFGQGACMAIEDAAVLARELGGVGDLRHRDAIAGALARYEARRIPRTMGVVQKAGRLARVNAWKRPSAVWMRDALVSAIPERVWLRTYEHERTYQL